MHLFALCWNVGIIAWVVCAKWSDFVYRGSNVNHEYDFHAKRNRMQVLLDPMSPHVQPHCSRSLMHWLEREDLWSNTSELGVNLWISTTVCVSNNKRRLRPTQGVRYIKYQDVYVAVQDISARQKISGLALRFQGAFRAHAYYL